MQLPPLRTLRVHLPRKRGRNSVELRLALGRQRRYVR